MMQISEWQLIAPHCNHSDKGKAIRALTGDNGFIKDIDYKVFTQMVKPYWRKTNNCIYDNCILRGMFDNKERKMSINK